MLSAGPRSVQDASRRVPSASTQGRRRVICVVTLSAGLLGACSGSPAAPVTATSKPGPLPPTGLGSTSADWDAQRVPAPGAPPGTAYGPIVATGVSRVPRYRGVVRSQNRIAAWDMAFGAGTRLARAVALLRAELPTDTQQTASWQVPSSGGSPACEVFQYESRTVGRVLKQRFPTGAFGVAFWRVAPPGQAATTVVTVTSAAVGLAPSEPSEPCPH
jgi:hypothetical protein